MKQLLIRWWKKRWVRICLVLMTLALALYLIRYPIMLRMGRFLVADDPLTRSECYFILGGNSYERGRAALEIFGIYPDARFVASGGNFPLQIMALDTMMTEASLTRHFLVRRGVPEAQVDTLSGSTSTMEESEEILAYCKTRGLKDITLISSDYHLRRMRMVFEDKYSEAGIRVHFRGASDEEFQSDRWWEDERGLITLNNEYVKIIYYWLKYD